MGARGLGLVTAMVALGAAVVAAPAGAASFSNPTPITTPTGYTGQANPYPSAIQVTGLSGTVVKARPTLNDIFAAANDLDVLLTGPGGGTMLFSDLCSSGGVLPDLIHLTYSFDED